jgi:hypothetical protein
MKRLFVAVMATAVMSIPVVYAGGDKKPARKQAQTKECTMKNCGDKKNCTNSGVCPKMPGCVCS